MNCDLWQGKIDPFVDAELAEDEARRFEEHLHECAACAAETQARQRLKLETRAAGKKFLPSYEFETRLQRRIARPRNLGWSWGWASAGVAAVIALAVFLGLSWRDHVLREQLTAQLVDQHVSALASANPVDVLSEDSHTVKPWFAGKVPFSVDIPQLTGTEFTLIGGRMAYFQQAPAAQLIFGVRKHKVSVFIFRDHGETSRLGSSDVPRRELSYSVESWAEDGLRYVAISDVNPADVRQLCALLRQADQWQ
jgi:anti-sigma factor RsiW